MRPAHCDAANRHVRTSLQSNIQGPLCREPVFSPRSSVCGVASTTKFCQISVKVGIETFYKELSEKGDFCENRPSDSHILLVGVNKSL
jgi:hypothetical protein